MDVYLQLISILLGTMILFFIIVGWLIERKRYKLAKISKMDFNVSQDYSSKTNSIKPTLNKKENPELNDILSISVFAKPSANFSSYDLLQAITGTGMQFGDMNIFHYYSHDSQKLFSLASATKPGYFNLDQIGDFSCIGLTLFMDLKAVEDPSHAFQMMLTTAEQLADDLEGELRASPQRIWNDAVLNEYQNKILQYS